MKKKKLETQYDDFAKEYENLHVGENKKSTEDFYGIIFKYVQFWKQENRRRSPKLHSMLDLGCGSGTDFIEYRKFADSIVGVDASPEMVSLVKKNFPEVWMEQGDFTEKDFFEHKQFMSKIFISN